MILHGHIYFSIIKYQNILFFCFSFPGQYYDAETELHYNWHRYYDPEVGRYVTADSIGLWGGYNLYSYTSQNPLNWIDSAGLDAVPIVFPDYQISTPVGSIGGLGHAGNLIINQETGRTKYYEYGRYDLEGDECKCGIAQKRVRLDLWVF